MTMMKTSLRSRLRAEIDRLAALADELNSRGLEEEARSLETTISDLGWQLEELDPPELVTAGSRSDRYR